MELLPIWVKNMEKRNIDLKEQKKELRKEIIQLRKSHTDEEIHRMSLDVLERIQTLSEYQEAKVIYAYMDCRHEVETRDLIRFAWKDGKCVALPRVCGQEMHFYYITSFENDLENGSFGIQEPRENNPANVEDALLLMPGVAFDIKRHRVGYGGGFYDRFLEAHPDLVTIALAFEFQVKEKVPFEKFDIRPAKVVTEQRVLT